MDPAPKLSISYVGIQYCTNLVMLIYCSKTKGVDIRGGLIGLNTNIKCI